MSELILKYNSLYTDVPPLKLVLDLQRFAAEDEGRTEEPTEKKLREAREKGQSESDALVRRARELIEREKVSAIAEVKKEVARLAIEVASKVVGETLKSDTEQQKLIERYINDIEANRN